MFLLYLSMTGQMYEKGNENALIMSRDSNESMYLTYRESGVVAVTETVYRFRVRLQETTLNLHVNEKAYLTFKDKPTIPLHYTRNIITKQYDTSLNGPAALGRIYTTN